MTTFAETPPPLRRLFDRLDFAPQPKDDALAHLLSLWEAERRKSGRIWPHSVDLGGTGGPEPRGFVFESCGDQDYVLTEGAAAVEPLLGSCAPGRKLSDAPQPRGAVRLRRLFDAVRQAGEPVLAEFRVHHRGEQAFAEILVAPLAIQGDGVDGLVGGISLRRLADRHLAAQTAHRSPQASGPVLFALGSSRTLAESISHHLGIRLAAHEERDFEDGEHKARPLVNIRNRDVYVVHSLHGDAEQSPNDKLCRLLFFIGALKDAAAARVTAVVPYLCYARKDRQTKSRDPVTTRYVAQLFEAVGVDRVITMEVHNPAAFQNAFRCDTEHLDATELFARHFQGLVGTEPVVIVSPDLGGAKRAETFRERLEQSLKRPVGKAFMDKQRSMGRVSGELFAGEVAGRVAIVVDDLISTGTTMARVAAACRERGAKRIYLAATHGLFVHGSPGLWREPAVHSVVVTDTVASAISAPPADQSRLQVVSAAQLFAEAIRRCHEGGSVTELLGGEGPVSEREPRSAPIPESGSAAA